MKSIHVPQVNTRYWLAITLSSLFGTVLSDDASRAIGEGSASIALDLLLGLVLFATGGSARSIFTCWGTVAVARTAGTSIGDWLAENHALNIGLPLSSLITAIAFVAVLMIWRPTVNPAQKVQEDLR